MNLAPKVLNPRINTHLNFWCVSLHCCMLVVCLLPLQVKRLSAQAGKKKLVKLIKYCQNFSIRYKENLEALLL